MLFSHEKPRQHQDRMIEDVSRCLSERKHLLAHAPTGIGKTAAVLGPALTYALENGKTVFFLTPKISQHRIAVDELAAIQRRHGASFTAVDVVGRQYACSDEVLADADHSSFYEACAKRRKDESCQYYANAVGFEKPQKEKARIAMEKLSDWYGAIRPQEEVADACRGFKLGGKACPLCAYEATAQLARKSSVVICDYYHLLSPHVSEAFLGRIHKKLEDSIIIIDEAHNVPDRLRKTMSSAATAFTARRAVKEAGLVNSPIQAKLEKLERELSKLERMADRESLAKKAMVPEFSDADMGDLLETGLSYVEATNRTRSACLALRSFYERWPTDGPEYLRVARRDNQSVEMVCLDASIASGPVVQEAHSVIAMSGTFTPPEMYRDLLGFPVDRTELREYPSPFPPQNRLNIISDKVTTRFAKRTEENFELIAAEVGKVVDAVPGNVAVFFPSYNVMRAVLSYAKLSKPVFQQKERATPAEMKALIDAFRSKSAFGGVLCAVAGGSAAEGIDYPGRDLIAAIVVGVPLKEWDLETKALVDYYEYKYGAGWNYGYLFPAMSRAIQAAGRVIRSESDRGVIVFLDERFRWANYARCFPKDLQVTFTRDAAFCVEDFFKTF